MDWNSYHQKRHRDFYLERKVKSIRWFSDADKIALAELNATCYHPKEDSGWNTRMWLEEIYSVLNHGCCNGCHALEKCKELSVPEGEMKP